MKRISLPVLLMWLLTLFVFIVPSLCLGQQKYGGTLRFGVQGDIKVLDPHKGRTQYEGLAYKLFCDNLVDGDKNFKPAPSLAESWAVSSDAKEWTFNLRKNVKFHNGREMTAEDIKYNFDRIRNKKTVAAARSKFVMVDSIQTVDKYTVKFILKQPSAGFLASFYGSGIQAPIVAPECVNDDGNITHPIGTGPFEFVEWKANEHLKVKKFKDYWEKGLPYLDEVILMPVVEKTVRLTALRTGELDIVSELSTDVVRDLLKEQQKDLIIQKCTEGNTWFLSFNCAIPPFNNKKVRQAFAYAINRQELTMGLDRGQSQVVNQYMSRNNPWYMDDVVDGGQNIQKAKTLLKEAGYQNDLDFKLTLSRNYSDGIKVAQILQAQVNKIGMNMELEILDWSAMIKKLVGTKFTAQSMSWNPYSDPEPWYNQNFHPEGANRWFNGNAYSNPKLTELLEQGGATVDLNERRAIYADVARILIDDSPWIFLINTSWWYAWKSHVKGFVPSVGQYNYAGGGLHYTWLEK